MPGALLLHSGDAVGTRPGDPAADECLPNLHPCPATQPPLPFLRRVLHPDGVQFAHPAEREFARLLAYYRVRWVYEPTTFALRWGEDGRAIECFAPDFYLPDHNLYIELTTMRQPLVTRKNRKLRRLRELYPGTRVRLLYRRDVLRLENAYRGRPAPAASLREVLWSEAEIADRVQLLAERVADEWLSRQAHGSPPVLVAVGSGATRFQHLLGEALGRFGIRTEGGRLDPSRFSREGTQRCVRALRQPSMSLEGRRVLLVGDIVSTGLSLTWAAERATRQRAGEIRACALFDRSAARLLDTATWFGFDAPDLPLGGFGLSMHRGVRNLPMVGTVEIGP